jgi:hypothetical protein
VKKTGIVALAVLLLLAVPIIGSAQVAPSGYLIVPDHHAGVMGDNEIVVTAADLQIGQEYLIDWYVEYHTNPRTPPPEGSIRPTRIEYTGIAFVPEQTEHTVTLASHLPDCHWQITAGITLYYRNSSGSWDFSGSRDASKGVDIWSDCTEPPEPPQDPGTGTPGYWKNHPEAWPVDEIVIGGTPYERDDAIELMGMPEKGDKTYTLFRAYVSAFLNGLIGNNTTCVDSEIAGAHDWLAAHPVGSKVKAGGKDSPWNVGEPMYILLDTYNNGGLCAPHRD